MNIDDLSYYEPLPDFTTRRELFEWILHEWAEDEEVVESERGVGGGNFERALSARVANLQRLWSLLPDEAAQGEVEE